MVVVFMAFSSGLASITKVNQNRIALSSWIRLMSGLSLFVEGGAACRGALWRIPYDGTADPTFDIRKGLDYRIFYPQGGRVPNSTPPYLIRTGLYFEDLLYVQSISIEHTQAPAYRDKEDINGDNLKIFTYLKVAVKKKWNSTAPEPANYPQSLPPDYQVEIPVLITTSRDTDGQFKISNCGGVSVSARYHINHPPAVPQNPVQPPTPGWYYPKILF
jgi:hypothetical protein